ncbi:MAG: hypothetical protein ABIP97_04950 [Chthoniobacterales bacterium]
MDTTTTRNTFPDIETKKLKKLYNDSRSIRTLTFLWFLGAVVIEIGVSCMAFLPGNLSIGGRIAWFVPVTLYAAFVFITAFGCLKRRGWGRICGIIVCVIALTGFPLGTLIGILGIVALSRSPQLFGPDRLDPDELIVEYKYRKKALKNGPR